MRSFVLVVLVVVSCSKALPPPPVEREASAPPVVDVNALPSSAIEAAAPIAKTYRSAYAKLTHDNLDECLDVSYVGEFDAGGLDPDAAWAKRMAPMIKEATTLRKVCGAQFADRTPLATCTVDSATKSDAGVFTIVVHHYLYESVGLSDAAMKDCFGMKGDWSPVSRDSREWHSAKLEYSQRQLHGLAKQAGVSP